MSFVRVKKAQTIKAEDLKGPETVSTGSLATTLTETNKILAEIQNQLAIDFANRIAEKKQTLKLSRKTGRKKKLGEKEEFVERGTKLQKSANAFGKKVLAPIKSIFDKLLDFLTIVGGGILLNAAWEWLQNEENRKNLVKIFTFLKTYWKEILVGLLTLKVVSAIGKLVGFATILRKLFKRLRGLGRKPRGAGGVRGINPPPGGGCGPVTGKGGCLDQLSSTSATAKNLAQTLFATAFAVDYFKGFARKTAPVKEERNNPLQLPGEKEVEEEKGKEREKEPFLPKVGEPVRMSPASYGPLIIEGIQKARQENRSQSIEMPDGGRVFIDRKGEVKTVKSGVEVEEGKIESKALLNVFVGLNAPVIARYLYGLGTRGLGAMFGKTGLGRNFLPKSQPGIFPGPRRAPGSPSGISSESLKTPGKKSNGNNVLPFQRPNNLPLADQKAAQAEINALMKRGLTREKAIGELLKSPQFRPAAESIKASSLVGGFSKGGTIFGKGSQTVDSVPAMLAPGEEIIRSSASNIFRPVLKDINDNAGRMFIAFRDATNRMTKNNDLQTDETSRSLTLFEKFKDLLDDQIQKIELEQFKEAAKKTLLVNGPTNNNTTGRTMLMSNTQQQSNATQNLLNQTQTEPQIQNLKVSLKAQTVDLNRYNLTRNRRTDSGEGSIQTLSMNLPGTVVDARTPTQAQPEEQPTDSSSTDIMIAPMDGNNPFFGRSFSAYGVDFT